MINFSKTILLSTFLFIFIIATGFFAYQWWQVKGELGKQIARNENLTTQVNELQAKIDKLKKEIEELKVAEQKVGDETTKWKTYRNELYEFEIDYPAIGWELDAQEEKEPFLQVEKRLDEKVSEEEKFYQFFIGTHMAEVDIECYGYPWRKEIRQEKMFQCIIQPSFNLKIEKEVTTKSGVKGFRGKGGAYFGRIEGVVFPLLLEEGMKDFFAYSYPILLIYYDLDTHYTEKEIEVFNKIISSFRYIEK